MKNVLFLLGCMMVFTVASCEKNDDSPSPERYIPTDADRARCAHIDQDAELGGYLYNLCLVNPWPTELPEVEVGGEPVLAAWINDTLAFVAYNPRESLRFNIKLTRDQFDGSIDLEGQRTTYEEIDESYMSFRLSFSDNGSIHTGSISRFRIRHHQLSGLYFVDTTQSSIDMRTSNGYGYGTFDLTLIDSTTDKTLTLTNGRFHAPFGG